MANNATLKSAPEPELPADLAFLHTGYGKDFVKLLHIRREGPIHHIKEFTVSTELTLDSKIDYLHGDNTDIVATDSQKNTVYVLAKLHGIRSPEEFGLLLCSHFLAKYPRVTIAKVCIEEHPWERLHLDDGPQHNHAFLSTPVAVRFACVSFQRGVLPEVESGLKDLRVIKTTQSAFTNFIHDEYSTLPDTDDRIFSTIIFAKWRYASTAYLDYDYAWNVVKDTILDSFAGSPDTGIFSPSVQNTLYIAQKKVLEKVPQMSHIEVELPNKHYLPVDFSKFPVGHKNKWKVVPDVVFQPTDAPSGTIYALLKSKL